MAPIREEWSPDNIRMPRRFSEPHRRRFGPEDPAVLHQRVRELEERVEDLAHRVSRIQDEAGDGD